MIWVIAPFAAIGAGVVSLLLCLFIGELVRAARQSRRTAAIVIRHAKGVRRKITCREWFFAFRRELFSSYSSLRIGFIEIPHDPSKSFTGHLPL